MRVKARRQTQTTGAVYCLECALRPTCRTIAGVTITEIHGCFAGKRIAGVKSAPAPKPGKVVITREAQGAADEVTIVVPQLPPSKNEWAGRHWRSLHKVFGLWHDALDRLMALRHYPRVPGLVDVEIELHYANQIRRDRMNYVCYPPLMDALSPRVVTPATLKRPEQVKRGLGIIDDDCDKCVRSLVILRPVVDGTEQTVIRIRRADDDRRAHTYSPGADGVESGQAG